MSIEPWRLAAAAALVLAYAGLCAALVWRERRRSGQARREASTLAASSDPASAGPATLVVFASQTGQAEAVAWRTGRALHTRGVPVRVLPLDELDDAALAQARRALFIASTYGEGDAPDGASLFVERWMDEADGTAGTASVAPSPQLPDLSYALLALGDRQYRQFCGFGRRLDEWLQHRGARPEFERIEADNLEADALAAWQRQLGLEPSDNEGDEPPAEADGPFTAWTLRRREWLNPGSSGAPIFLLVFEAPAGGARTPWSSGDLAQVLIPGDEPRPRDYSIASIQADGVVELLVRQVRHADGRLGLASAWLTTQLEP
ncbi:MAG: oxidoreductase, partial [Comamonadaceae bacterium]